MKTREEIRATTTGKIPRPANYKPHQTLMQWDASLAVAGEPDLLTRLHALINDRILVRLLKPGDVYGDEPQPNKIILTDAKPLIGGECRRALVLRCGPGKLMPGEWWKVPNDEAPAVLTDDFEVNAAGLWKWFPGERRPVSVRPGQIVYIGNWVDLEADGLALCQEGDVRGYV